MEYETITLADQVRLAEDSLRGVESDHFRLSLLEPDSGRLDQLAARRDEIKAKLDALKTEVEGPHQPAELKDLKVDALRALAEERGIEVKANAKKAELIEALSDE